MEKREINRCAAWLSAAAAVVVIAGCANAPSVPPSDTLARGPAAAFPAAQSGAAAAGGQQAPVTITRRHVVRRGDTLSGIAAANGCSLDDLRAWNGLGPKSRLRIGQVLRIVAKSASAGNAGGAAVSASAATTAASVAAATQAAAAPSASSAPSLQSDRQVISETKRHARGVSLAWPAHGNVIEAFRPGVNRGIQIAGRAGDPVRAAADGRVMYAGVGLNDYGSLIIVQHNADFLTAYAHNRKLLVKTGDIVRRGQEIAEMGDLDNARVALAFELRRDGKPVNPLPYLPSTSG